MNDANLAIIYLLIKYSEYDQEIPQLQTTDNPIAPRGRAAQPLKEIRLSYFLLRNQSMKFQNPILNLKRFLYIKFSMTTFAKGDNSKKIK